MSRTKKSGKIKFKKKAGHLKICFGKIPMSEKIIIPDCCTSCTFGAKAECCYNNLLDVKLHSSLQAGGYNLTSKMKV